MNYKLLNKLNVNQLLIFVSIITIYLYLVYSKGGRISIQDEEDDLFSLYRRPWNSPEKENFTVKLRYRF